jgi:hypothetical protein
LATPRNQRWLCGTGTIGRESEDLAGLAQREEKAARAALDRQPGLRERLGAGGLKPFGKAALEIAKGLLVRHSLIGQSNAWIFAMSSVGSTGLTM